MPQNRIGFRTVALTAPLAQLVTWVIALAAALGFSTPALATSAGSNGKIAFLDGRSIATVNPDGTGLTIVATPPTGLSYQDPAWSPDGKRIAFISGASLNVMNDDGTGLMQVTSSSNSLQHPTWSSDSRQIAVAVQTGTFATSISVINADGTGGLQTLLSMSSAFFSQPAWSPDGTKIAVVEQDLLPGAGKHITLVNANGTGLTRLTSGKNDASPTWSPDGTQIAFESLGQIYRIKVDGTGLTNLTNGAGNDVHPSWSPDGTRIAFQSADIQTMSAVDGSGRVQLLSCDCANSPDWQPLPGGPGLPSLSINDVSNLDGNFGTTNATFTVSLSTASNQVVTVNFATADGTARGGRDYQATSGTLAFAPGETSKPITVLIYGNVLPEPDKTFFVNLSSPINAKIARGQGTGTILNANTTLAINDVTVTRGASGTTAALFTVSLSPPASFPVTVDFATANGGATSPLDYVAQSGRLTFSPLETSKQISIAVNGRIANQPPQTFFVNLSHPTNAIIAKASGLGTIINPGFPPVTPGPQVVVTRLAPGTQFQVELETQTMGMNAAGDFVIAWVQPGTPRPPINEGVTSIYAQRFNSQGIAQGAAFRVDDPNSTLFEALGSKWQPAAAMDASGNSVVVWTGGVGDTVNAFGEIVGKIHAQRYDALGNPVGTNFYVNTSDDGVHEFQPSVAMYASGDFVVAWNTGQGCASCVFAQRFDASGARLGDKFLVSSLAKLGFEPAVAVSPVEPVGNFVILWTGSDGVAGNFAIFGRLFASDGTPLGSEFRVNTFNDIIPEHPGVGMDANGNFTAVWDGDDGTATRGIEAQRFNTTGLALGGQFKVNATTFGVARPTIGVAANGNFVVAWDGVDCIGSCTSPTSVFARVYHGDGAPQGADFRVNEAQVFPLGSFRPAARMDFAGNFVVSWQADLGANLGGILFRRFAGPPPAQPSLIIGNAIVAKPPSGTADAVFTVRLSTTSTQTITVNFGTADGTAHAGTDYTAASGTLTFAPGEMSKQIIVRIYGGAPNSSNKTFFVNLSNPTNATIFRAQGRGTIPAPLGISYTISAAPRSLALLSSSSKTSAIMLHSQNGVSESVQLTANWVGTAPTGVTIALSSTQVTVPSSGDFVSTTLTVTTLSSASSGPFTLRISGLSSSGVARLVDLTIVIDNNLPAPACGCTNTGPFVDPRVKALVQPDATGMGPNRLATVSGSGFITVTRNDGRTVVPATSDVSAFGFSPNGKFFVVISQVHPPTGVSVTLYSVEKPGLVGTSPLVTNALSWGFSPDSDNQFFLVTSSDDIITHIDVAIYDTGSGTRVMFEPAHLNPSFGTAPAWEKEKDVEDNDTDDDSKNDDKNIGGWGFSPDGKTFLLSFKTGQNEAFVGLWSLTHNTNFQLFGVTSHDVAGFWQFSPCGELFMWVHQAGANPATSDPVEFLFTSNGHRYKQVNLAPLQPPSATVVSATVTPDSQQILLTGMSPSTIPNPQCMTSGSVFSPVNILLTDEKGRSTGFDPGIGGALSQIPGGSYTGVGSEPQTISVPYVAGPYLLDAFGLASLTSSQPYHLRISITDGSGDVVSQRDFSAMASRGSKDHYGFTVKHSASSGLNRILVPPLIEAAFSGTLGNNGWYISDVGVSWNVTPLSEITSMPGCQPLTVTSDTLGATFTCAATNADGTSSKSVTIKRNATPPAITVFRTPGPNANDWNNTDVTVSFTASALSGIASVSGPVTLTSEGAKQVITGTATSLAGISASVTVTVNIDKTPPEAFSQFDPVNKALQVFGRDLLSGVPSGAIKGNCVPTNWSNDDENKDGGQQSNSSKDDNDKQNNAQLCTYAITDLAGNTLALVAKVKDTNPGSADDEDGHDLKFQVVSTKYTGGSAVNAPYNLESFEWSLNKDKTLKKLNQSVVIGNGKNRIEVSAEYDSRKNQTTIEADKSKESEVVKPGLALLRMATKNGALVIEY